MELKKTHNLYGLIICSLFTVYLWVNIESVLYTFSLGLYKYCLLSEQISSPAYTYGVPVSADTNYHCTDIKTFCS